MNATPSFKISSADATDGVASELDVLLDRLKRLEDGFETVLDAGGDTPRGVTLQMFQEMDFIVQSIESLSTYLRDVASASRDNGETCLHEAVSKIPLRDMAARLKGHEAAAPITGEAELF
ncbi:MAG: hypothetical protein JXQ89_07845 [Pelagimonas sp.]